MVKKWKKIRRHTHTHTATQRHTHTYRGHVFISAYCFQSNGICSHRCKQMENKCSIFLCHTAGQLNHNKDKTNITEKIQSNFFGCTNIWCVCTCMRMGSYVYVWVRAWMCACIRVKCFSLCWWFIKFIGFYHLFSLLHFVHALIALHLRFPFPFT